MRNLDRYRCWRCTLCPCKVRSKFIVNFWNRTIVLCIPCAITTKMSSFSVQCAEFDGAHKHIGLSRSRRHHTNGPASPHFCADANWHWSTTDSKHTLLLSHSGPKHYFLLTYIPTEHKPVPFVFITVTSPSVWHTRFSVLTQVFSRKHDILC